MLVKLYESYGCLGREKTPVYSEFVPGSNAYNQITVDVPDDIIYITAAGEHCVMMTAEERSRGWGWPLAERLELRDDKLYITWSDGDRYKNHRQMIDVVERV